MREEPKFGNPCDASTFRPFLAEVLRTHNVHAPFPNCATLRAETASEEAKEDIEEFAEALCKWWPYVRPKFRPLVPAWVEAIEQAMSVPLSSKAIKILRGMMRKDIDAQTEALWEADKGLMKEWVAFNPRWINRLIAERAALDPMLLMPPAELVAAKKVHTTAGDTARKRAMRGRKLSRKIFDHLRSQGGTVIWDATELARTLSSKGGGKRLEPDKIYDAASALVVVGVAHWIKDRDGNQSQLQLVDERLMLPAPDTFH